LGIVQHLRAADARRVPWKNGRGFTDELALWPPGASFVRADFDWRISKAAVEEDGPFSSFPGIERVLVVTEGAGIVLDHGTHAPRVKLERLVPYRFSGDWPTRAELVDGRVADFNVLCRRGVVRAEVEVLEARAQRSVQIARHEHALLHVLEGELEACRASGRDSWRLTSGESLCLRDEQDVVSLLATGRGILVRIAAAAGA